MQISNVTHGQLTEALGATDPNLIWVSQPEALNAKQTRWSCRLRVSDSRKQYARRGYHIRRDGERQRLVAACWHGYRDFLLALFEVAPDARVKTVHATYADREDFNRKFEETGWANIGSQWTPLYFREACDCQE